MHIPITDHKQLNQYLVAITTTLTNMRDKNIKPSKSFFDNLFNHLKIMIDKSNVLK